MFLTYFPEVSVSNGEIQPQGCGVDGYGAAYEAPAPAPVPRAEPKLEPSGRGLNDFLRDPGLDSLLMRVKGDGYSISEDAGAIPEPDPLEAARATLAAYRAGNLDPASALATLRHLLSQAVHRRWAVGDRAAAQRASTLLDALNASVLPGPAAKRARADPPRARPQTPTPPAPREALPECVLLDLDEGLLEEAPAYEARPRRTSVATASPSTLAGLPDLNLEVVAQRQLATALRSLLCLERSARGGEAGGSDGGEGEDRGVAEEHGARGGGVKGERGVWGGDVEVEHGARGRSVKEEHDAWGGVGPEGGAAGEVGERGEMRARSREGETDMAVGEGGGWTDGPGTFPSGVAAAEMKAAVVAAPDARTPPSPTVSVAKRAGWRLPEIAAVSAQLPKRAVVPRIVSGVTGALAGHSVLQALREGAGHFERLLHSLEDGRVPRLREVAGLLQTSAGAAIEAWGEAHPDGRRGRACGSAEHFAKAVAAATVRALPSVRGGGAEALGEETWVEQRARRRAAGAAGAWAGNARLPVHVLANREPFRHGAWRQAPYPARPYENLTESVVAEKLVLEEVEARICCEVGDDSEGTEGNASTAASAPATTTAPAAAPSIELALEATPSQTAKLISDVRKRDVLRLGEHVREVDSWGMDCYSRRNVQDAALLSGVFGPWVPPDYGQIVRDVAEAAQAAAATTASGSTRGKALAVATAVASEATEKLPAGSHGGGPSSHEAAVAAAAEAAREASNAVAEAACAAWIEHALLPAINAGGRDGWDLGRALEVVRAEASAGDDAASAGAAEAVLDLLRRIGPDHFRVHPKGVGVIVSTQAALPPLTLVEEYLGEVHPSWRWFELQDMVKKATGSELPDFYNIALERPRHDPRGYDALFVDATRKGTFASRVSHSCTPNCAASPMRVRGRLRIVLYTIREVRPGEELTFDYACVSESEREFREAICLCGTPGCRGSYLYFTGSRGFSAIISAKHTSLDRVAMVLRASTEPLTTEDEANVADAGIGEAALGDPRRGFAPPPRWLVKWCSLAADFMAMEERLLREVLLREGGYTEAGAAAEARGVFANRLQNAAITLDKVKLVLGVPGQPQGPPLRELEEPEVLAHLWHGPRGIARRTLLGLLERYVPALARAVVRARDPVAAAAVNLSRLPEAARDLACILSQPVDRLESARTLLAVASESARALDLAAGGGATALADLLELIAATRTWITTERGYKSRISPPLPTDVARMHLPKGAAVGSDGGGKRRGGADAGESSDGSTAAPSTVRPLARLGRAELAKVYRPGYVWAQLHGWHKQTVADPTASLSAERRGTLSLPDVESAFAGSRYSGKERADLLESLRDRPTMSWKAGTIWSFKNEGKIYGSPMLDSAIARARGLGPEADPFPAVLQRLEAAALPPSMAAFGRARATKRGGSGRRGRGWTPGSSGATTPGISEGSSGAIGSSPPRAMGGAESLGLRKAADGASAPGLPRAGHGTSLPGAASASQMGEAG